MFQRYGRPHRQSQVLFRREQEATEIARAGYDKRTLREHTYTERFSKLFLKMGLSSSLPVRSCNAELQTITSRDEIGIIIESKEFQRGRWRRSSGFNGDSRSGLTNGLVETIAAHRSLSFRPSKPSLSDASRQGRLQRSEDIRLMSIRLNSSWNSAHALLGVLRKLKSRQSALIFLNRPDSCGCLRDGCRR